MYVIVSVFECVGVYAWIFTMIAYCRLFSVLGRSVDTAFLRMICVHGCDKFLGIAAQFTVFFPTTKYAQTLHYSNK